jgi:lipid A disaccharide synthetase
LIQHEASVENLVRETRDMLFNQSRRQMLTTAFSQIHQTIRMNASATAAGILAEMIAERRRES